MGNRFVPFILSSVAGYGWPLTITASLPSYLTSRRTSPSRARTSRPSHLAPTSPPRARPLRRLIFPAPRAAPPLVHLLDITRAAPIASLPPSHRCPRPSPPRSHCATRTTPALVDLLPLTSFLTTSDALPPPLPHHPGLPPLAAHLITVASALVPSLRHFAPYVASTLTASTHPRRSRRSPRRMRAKRRRNVWPGKSSACRPRTKPSTRRVPPSFSFRPRCFPCSNSTFSLSFTLYTLLPTLS